MTLLRIGLLPWQVGGKPGLDGWTARLAHSVAEAAGQGARLLVLPEYAAMDQAAGDTPDLATELRRGCDLAPAMIAASRDIARRHGVWLLPGSFPLRDGDRVHNRAPLIAPDGRLAFQDKHVMTRFEDEEWGVSPGAPPAVFDTEFGRIGIAICLDAEFPPLVRAQVEAGAWLILAPSCTDTRHGFNRVRIAAAARAMENQCFVALVPTVGDNPASAALDTNRGHAALFGPVDRGFPEDGLLARGPDEAGQWLFCDLDPARIEAVRREGAVRNHRAWPPAPPPCQPAAFA